MCHLSGGNRRIDEKGAQRASGQELMSALGQNWTFRSDQSMSALPPKADIAECEGESAFCHKRHQRRLWLSSAPGGSFLRYLSVS